MLWWRNADRLHVAELQLSFIVKWMLNVSMSELPEFYWCIHGSGLDKDLNKDLPFFKLLYCCCFVGFFFAECTPCRRIWTTDKSRCVLRHVFEWTPYRRAYRWKSSDGPRLCVAAALVFHEPGYRLVEGSTMFNQQSWLSNSKSATVDGKAALRSINSSQLTVSD